eukprot:TRINITY_DN61906_c0_g1_i1.p1 TRINITY_DN61906_c0_g1~~TRINITY_DN61906_c0_g1_i1.p1  ORF type:complete len:784 (+),score=106.48 TRINITY_DN61906_c0_g1_i1:73-2424(+)
MAQVELASFQLCTFKQMYRQLLSLIPLFVYFLAVVPAFAHSVDRFHPASRPGTLHGWGGRHSSPGARQTNMQLSGANAVAAAAAAAVTTPGFVEDRFDTPSFHQLGADRFDQLRFSVVRIRAISSEPDFFFPFEKSRDVQGVGSGFFVDTKEGPVIVTNAHVVSNAHLVQVQLPVLGKDYFRAHVPLISKDFDLAIVNLSEPEELNAKLKQMKMPAPKPLSLAGSRVAMGMDVVAFGFPLGSTSPKMSAGVVAGTEEIQQNLVYQSTAPISPGNSGGPLLKFHERTQEVEVVGANFAAAASRGAQNINFVVPAFRISQVLRRYEASVQAQSRQHVVVAKTHGRSNADSMTVLLETSDKRPALISTKEGLQSRYGAQSHNTSLSSRENKTHLRSSQHREHVVDARGASIVQHSDVETISKDLLSMFLDPVGAEGHFTQLKLDKIASEKDGKSHAHVQMRIAPVGVLTQEARQALYDTSRGCQKGVFVAKIFNRSMFKLADPPVQGDSFLEALDDIPLDQYGAGRNGKYLSDPVNFAQLLSLRSDLDEPIVFRVCKDGTITNHTASLKWRPEYEPGVRMIEEPHYEPESLSYEFFAGVSVMPMTQNHLIAMLQSQDPMSIATATRFLTPEEVTNPKLIVNYVEKGTYADQVLDVGMIVEQVNNKKTTTLSEYGKVFLPDEISAVHKGPRASRGRMARREVRGASVIQQGAALGDRVNASTGVWRLRTQEGRLLAARFREELGAQVQRGLLERYVMTSAVRHALVTLSSLDAGDVSDEREVLAADA